MTLFKRLNGKKSKLRIFVGVLTLGIILGMGWFLLNPTESDAAWFDDNYHYRTGYSFTHNAALTDRRLDITIDTATLISAGKMQSDCDDSRFTDSNGKVLRYQLVANCNNASTSYSIVIPTVVSGLNSYYFYYGNQAAVSNSDTTVASITSVTPSGGSPSGATEEKGPAPVLYWKLDDATGTTVKDASINNNTGTITTAAWQSESDCVIGKCLKFNGAGDYLSRTYSTDTELNPGTDSFTVSSWFKHDTAIGGTDVLVFRFSSGGYGIYMNSSGFLCFGIDDDSSSFPEDSACSTTGYADAQWHFVEAVKTGTSSITLYIDGKQVAQDASLSATGSLSGSSPTLYVGDEGANINPWLGLIDEIKIYDYAKSSNQVNADFASKGTIDGASATFGGSDAVAKILNQGLIGYWKMDETAADSCLNRSDDNCDSSGNGNDLYWTNQAAAGTGKFGGGVVLDGDDDGTQRNLGLVSGLTNSKRWTIATWFKSASDTQGYLFDTRGGDGAALYLDGTDTVKLYYTQNAGPLVKDITYTAAVTNTNWHHAVMTRDGDNSISVYIDGQKLTPTALTTNDDISALQDSLTNIYFGHRYSGNIYPLQGTIDEARLYSRAFSPTDVQTLYDWAPGPVGYWKFDENAGSIANDASGNGNTGTMVNSPGWTTGKYGSALQMTTASTQYVNAGNGTTLQTTSTPFTVSAWVNVADMTSSNNFITKYGNSSNRSYRTRVNTSGKFIFEVSGDGVDANIVSVTGSTTLTTGTWYYITAEYVPSTSITVYVNGKQDGQTTTSIPSSLFNTTDPVNFGSQNTGAAQNLSGKMDEVRIYNYARTLKQIISDMNGGHPNVGSPVGSAIGYWKFDEGQGTTANNSGSAGSLLSGTLTNMASPATSTSGWYSSGKFGKALAFDSSNDTVNAGSDSSVDDLSNLTASAWIYATSTGENARGRVFDKTATGTPTNGWLFSIGDGTNNTLRFIVDYSTTDLTVSSTTNLLSLNAWHHVAATWDGSTTATNVHIYLDGIEVTYATQINGSGTRQTDAAQNLNIGNDTSGQRTFAGRIDEARLYNYILNADEIKLDMNQGKSQVLGSLSTAADGVTNDNSNTREYCVPGDTSSCSAPIAEWKFDENTGITANDSSGNANTATLTNGPTWAPARSGQGIAFDGSNDYLAIPSQSGLSATAGTITAWVKPTVASPAAVEMIVMANRDTNRIYLLRSITSGNLAIRLGSSAQVDTGVVVPANVWSNVSVTWNSGTYYAYLNNRMVSTGAYSGLSTLDGFSRIGAYDDNAGDTNSYFTGIIDQVRIYNYARSQAQTAWEYNKGGPVGWWKFDECQGTTANDASGNGNNGTITIGATGTYTAAGTCNSGTSTHAWNAGAVGKYNGSLGFDGIDDEVSVANESSKIANTSAMTIAGWVYPPSNPSDHAGYFGFRNDSSSDFYVTQLQGGTTLECRFRNSGGTATTVSNTITPNTWQHVALIYTGSTLTCYVNGVPSISSAASGTITEQAETFKIGKSESNSFYLSGKLDDVRLYNYALTQLQLKTVINENSATRFGP